MLEKFSLKKQIEELEQHLNIINSNLNELNQISPDTDFNNINLYKQLTLYYLSTKEIEPKNFIKDYIETINITVDSGSIHEIKTVTLLQTYN